MVVEDHDALRELLAYLIDREPDLEVVARAGTLHETLQHASSVACDAALVDTKLPDGYGADLIAGLRELRPGSRVVMSATMSPESLARAAEASADAVVDKLGGPGEMLEALRRGSNG